jgi:D-alanyl-D-alanine dipeptidase
MRNKRQRTRKRVGLVLSGKDWVNQFPTSRSVDDLASPFRENVSAFLAALQAAGANVKISATYRPAERAFLMHYAYRIAREGFDPRNVPARQGIDIDWVHRKANNQVDLAASKNAAEDMVQAYGIVYRPALNSQHTARRAIDMTISWSGTLSIANARGTVVDIAGSPRSGQNSQLIAVGKTYGVVKLVSDPPHWSQDGTLHLC